ncbi:MAG: rhomboid family intramembrane serine protease [candidate division WOR-3 bacterium]
MIPLKDDIRSSHRPVINYLIIAATSAVWILQFTSSRGNEFLFNRQLIEFGMVPANIVTGKKLWTLLSSMFMHGGWFHFLGNMLYLWIFGDNVEDAFGHLAYPLVYLVTGICGSLLQIGTTIALGGRMDIPTIGASGAISGVMGAYFVLFPRARVLTLIPFFIFMRIVALPAGLLLGFWVLFQILYGCSASVGAGGGVAYFAHVGGFAAGVVAGLMVKNRVRRPWYEIT